MPATMQSLRAPASATRPAIAAPGARRPVTALLQPAVAAPRALGGASCFLCGQRIASARPAPAEAAQRRGRSAAVRVHARAGGDLEVQDRILGALPYVVPLLDGIRYGRYFFAEFPLSAQLLSPLRPLVSVYYSVPFLSLIVFFALFSGVVNNASLSRHVRFNAMQAVLLSVLLIFPTLIEQVLRPSGQLGLQLHINLYNSTFLFVATCVAYGVGSSLLGRAARLPLIASAAEQRIF